MSLFYTGLAFRWQLLLIQPDFPHYTTDKTDIQANRKGIP
jgi:hypothetical protein